LTSSFSIELEVFFSFLFFLSSFSIEPEVFFSFLWFFSLEFEDEEGEELLLDDDFKRFLGVSGLSFSRSTYTIFSTTLSSFIVTLVDWKFLMIVSFS
jgi:hypothetical protein